MLGPGGWLLIDWETAQIAPPERDLWNLDGGGRGDPARLCRRHGGGAATGPAGLYRMRWDLADVAVTVADFRRHHGDTADDQTFVEAVAGPGCQDQRVTGSHVMRHLVARVLRPSRLGS